MTSKKERQEVEFEVVGIQKPHRRSSFMRDYGFPYPMVNNSELTSEERDKLDLLRLGKTSVLKRNFGFLAITAFSCVTMATWETILVYYTVIMENGGPAGLFYGFVIAWICITSVYACLSELSSMACYSGGQYFWVSMLAPTSSQKFLSYTTGWLNLCGWQATYIAATFLTGDLIQSLRSFTNPSYTSREWTTMLVMWACGLFALFLNAFSRTLLPRFQGFILLFHILGFVAIVTTLSVFGSRNSPATVFKGWLNEGDWSTQGLASMICLVQPALGFAGVDAPIHMAEEITHASLTVPRAIMASTTLNGMMGIAVAVVLAFTVTDIKDVFTADSNYPILDVLGRITNSKSGATTLMIVSVMIALNTTTTSLACVSRLLWSFSRDRGVPGWSWLGKVDKRTSLPLASMYASSVVLFLLSFLVLGSPNAFKSLVSLTVSGLYASYIIPIALLLWRRVSSGIVHPSAAPSEGVLFNSSGKQLVWGPWHIPGVWGTINNAFACCFVVMILFFSFWPTSLPVTIESMNYSSVIFAGALFLAVTFYFWRGRKHYVGPVIEVGIQ